MIDADQDSTRDASAMQELNRLVEQARTGDETVLPDLQRALVEHPEIWQHFGNLASHIQGQWVKLLAGSDLAIRESLLCKADAMRVELAGQSPSQLERLLCDAIVTTWLESEYFGALLVGSNDKGTSRQIESLHSRRDSAHRRYMVAIKTLAETRRLLGTTASGEPGAIGGTRTIRRARTTAGSAVATDNASSPQTIPMRARSKS